jgi:Tol biopolymer transport system component
MGQVYRANDTTLGRQVAVKILPDAFGADPERLARFVREAQTLAALNHPHIAAIYAVEKSAGVHALVMELVEGEDLSQRIARGAIPIEDALPMAKQIAEALEAAHEQNIIHRDLKPANIKVRADGTLKLLDFGLAKAAVAGLEASVHSPTFTSPPALTMGGMIIGTAAYMAPEQARGRNVDKRADIWAFGLVLYEMLSGRAAFAGDTVTDILAAVVTRDPDWTALPVATPRSIKRLLARCLEKDPRRRLRDIGDARLEIEESIAPGEHAGHAGESLAGPAGAAARSGAHKLVWAVAGVALASLAVAAAVFSGVWPRPRAIETRPLRLSFVHTEGSEVGAPVIAPDGTRVAYRARRADGMPMLWVRDLARGESLVLPGTEDAAMPFWSPDSRDLGFFAGVMLKRVSAAGGPVRMVADNVGTFGANGGAWGADGTIAFSGGLGLLRVPADGGAVTPLTKPATKDWVHLWPSFLADGRRFLFTAKLWTSSAESSEQGIYLGSLDSPDTRKLLPDLSSAVYATPGYLVFAREGALTAVPFDASGGRVTGAPVAIGAPVASDAAFYFAAVSAAADGTLAVRPPPTVTLINVDTNAFNAELHTVDRTGAGGRTGSARLFSYFMALHPDNRTLAAGLLDARSGTQDLWLIDLVKDTSSPLTATRGFAGLPVWSADGRRLAYAYQRPGELDDVYIRNMATGLSEPVTQTPVTMEHPSAWSHDGKALLVFNADDKGTYLSWWSFESRTLTRLIGPRAVESAASFSPHDDFVAFTSQESGRAEVYVTTFPQRTQTWPLTTDGGRILSWSKDGREILVSTLSGHIVAYPVSTDGGFSHGQPTTLVRDAGYAATFSTATPDHSRIILRVSPDAAKDKGEIRLLFGWQNGLGK